MRGSVHGEKGALPLTLGCSKNGTSLLELLASNVLAAGETVARTDAVEKLANACFDSPATLPRIRRSELRCTGTPRYLFQLVLRQLRVLLRSARLARSFQQD